MFFFLALFFWCSTPSKPVHCIVWAKQLFVLMFGKVEESMLFEDPVTGQSAFMDQVGFVSTVPFRGFRFDGFVSWTSLFVCS